MGNPSHTLHGRAPLGVGKTHTMDGRLHPKRNESQNPDSSKPPESTSYLRVWFGWANGRPAVFEYEPQTHWFWGVQIHEPFQRKSELSFKPPKPRSWYEVGDLVLHSELDERRLIRLFPELAKPPGEEESLLKTLALGLLLGPPDDYKIAYTITKISPGSDGKGQIELTPTLILDDSTFVELEQKAIRSQSDLSSWWGTSISMQALLSIMKPIVSVYYEVAMALATGGVGSITRAGGRRAVLFTLRQARRKIATRVLARKIVTGLAKNSTKATLAATKSFASTFAKTYHGETSKQEMAHRTEQGEKIDRHAFDVALKKAAGAFVSTLISQLLDVGLDDALKKSGYNDIQQEISKRIMQAFGTQVPATFINSIAAAWAAESQHPGTFADNLSKALVAGLQGQFTSLVKVDVAALAESLMKE